MDSLSGFSVNQQLHNQNAGPQKNFGTTQNPGENFPADRVSTLDFDLQTHKQDGATRSRIISGARGSVARCRRAPTGSEQSNEVKQGSCFNKLPSG